MSTPLTSKDLRVGNIIKDNKGNEIVVTGKVLFDLWSSEQWSTKAHGYSGVELTEERLLQFGFRCIDKEDKAYCIGFKNNDDGSYSCDFEVNINDDNSWHLELSSVEIFTVHHLQNVFFALTGSDLSITENKTQAR